MLIKLARTYLAPYKQWLTMVVLLQFVGTLGALYLPKLNADIIDNGVITGDTGYIMRTGAVMLAVALVQVLCSVGAVWFGARTAMGFGRDVRAAIFHRVGSFSQREVQDFGAPSLITRETNDVQQVQMLVLMSCTLMVMAPIMMVGGIVMAMHVDVGLSWLIVMTVPVLAGAMGLIVTRMVPSFRLMQTRIDEVNRLLREQITGVRVVRAFVREDRETERFATANGELTDVATRAGRYLAAMFPTVMLVANVASVAVLWFGGHRVDSGAMQIGALTAYLAYLMQIVMAVMMGTFMMMMLPRAAVCADRVTEVLDTETSVPRPAEPVTDLPLRGTLELDGVELTYPGADAPVLRDLSFRAEPGQTVAVIGSTGAGKSTLVNLVPRLFDVTGGELRVDGVDVRRLAPERLWSVIGLMPQRAYLFSGTVRVQPAARQAGRHRRGAVVGAGDRPGGRLRPGDGSETAGARRPDRPGRHQRQRRPAAAARHRARGGEEAGDLPVRRLVLRPRPGHRRAAPRGAAAGHPRRDGADRRPTGVHDPRRRPDPGARGRRGRRPRHPRGAARHLGDLPGDRRLPARGGGGGMSRDPMATPPRSRVSSRRPSGSPRAPVPVAARWAAAWSARRPTRSCRPPSGWSG